MSIHREKINSLLQPIKQYIDKLRFILSEASCGREAFGVCRLSSIYVPEGEECEIVAITNALSHKVSIAYRMIAEDIQFGLFAKTWSKYTALVDDLSAVSQRIEAMLKGEIIEVAEPVVEAVEPTDDELLSHLEVAEERIDWLTAVCQYASEGWDYYDKENTDYRSARDESYRELGTVGTSRKDLVSHSVRRVLSDVEAITEKVLHSEWQGLTILQARVDKYQELFKDIRSVLGQVKEFISDMKRRELLIPIFPFWIPPPEVVNSSISVLQY
ncbi:hypothetical protein CLI64_11145 [Nostoc sp. CENA543]|uniref:hypothetical protein n=1 Tax=Nostoc sp. CENA543 TaxID=1869241 RepID=UPI000CA2E083|nr:hypothetical protein [Nostoc sp. CENA543]AUT00910.1 hypothetical protein CLI64_11145 [Nostoc sp. CENA543]